MFKKIYKAADESMQKFSPVKFFIITASFFGLLFLVITPPFQTPDEPLHFYRAYQISQFNFVVDVNEGNDSGGIIPASLKQTVDLTTNNSNLGNLMPEDKYDNAKTAEAMSIKEDTSRLQWTNFTSTALYTPIVYAPQAFGILVAHLLDMPPILMMYLGRLMNLVVWIALFALSIRLMPRKKWAVVFIGLLPVAIAQAASMTADVVTVSSFAVFLAGVLYLRERKKSITWLEIVALLAIMTTMALSKQVMIIFLPLIFLISNAQFKAGKRGTFIKILLILVPLLLCLTWAYIMKDLDLKSVLSRNQDPPGQLSFILHNPHSFINALWNTHFFSQGDIITHSFMGTFGWGETKLSELIVVVGYVALFLVLLINPDKRVQDWLTIRQKLFVAFITVAYIIGVSAALYLYFNPVGAKIIEGIQGRYLFPVALLVVPLISGGWIKTDIMAYKRIAVLAPIFLLIASLVTISFRYYLHSV